MKNYDIIIVGSGIVGSATAIALAQKFPFNIAVLESETVLPSNRVSAFSIASKNILSNLQVWDKLDFSKVSMYEKMYVWDAKKQAEIIFEKESIHENCLGYIAYDYLIRTTLHKRFEALNIDLISPIQLQFMEKTSNAVVLETQQGEKYQAKLLVGADGGNSWVRQQTNISFDISDYQQNAIVATVVTEKPHQQTAWQVFLDTGPLAFLPLNNKNECSIVWSYTSSRTDEILLLPTDALKNKLSGLIADKLGKIESVDNVQHFPLRMRHVKNYVQDHIALVGDAAHTIHPLAGQGVNLGLLDTACLVDVIANAYEKNRPYYKKNNLRPYELARKSENFTMLAMVGFLKNIFATESEWVSALRGTGLALTNRCEFLKKILIQHAVGKRGHLPSLAKEYS